MKWFGLEMDLFKFSRALRKSSFSSPYSEAYSSEAAFAGTLYRFGLSGRFVFLR